MRPALRRVTRYNCTLRPVDLLLMVRRRMAFAVHIYSPNIQLDSFGNRPALAMAQIVVNDHAVDIVD